jgi:hypothetical protein
VSASIFLARTIKSLFVLYTELSRWPSFISSALGGVAPKYL